MNNFTAHFLKTHLLAFALGVLCAAALVLLLTSGDKAVKRLAENKKNIKTKVVALKEENTNATASLKEELQKIQTATKNEKAKASGALAKLQAQNVGLKKEVAVLKLHIGAQSAIIAGHEKLHGESLAALNKASKALAIKAAREKATAIGVGVGVPLMLIGGFVGGFYLAGVVK